MFSKFLPFQVQFKYIFSYQQQITRYLVSMKKQLKSMEATQSEHTVILQEIRGGNLSKDTEEIELPSLPFQCVEDLVSFDRKLASEKKCQRSNGTEQHLILLFL